jgi:uncharacterized protein DUF6958
MSEETIKTRHPQGKTGRTISRQKYDAVRKEMLSALRSRELTHTELFQILNRKLKGKVDGNISWYGETVKLDLEARKQIQRTTDRPQRYRIK